MHDYLSQSPQYIFISGDKVPLSLLVVPSQTQDTFSELRKHESCDPLLPPPPLLEPAAGPGREDQHPGHQGAGLPPLRHGRGRGLPHRQGISIS